MQCYTSILTSEVSQAHTSALTTADANVTSPRPSIDCCSASVTLQRLRFLCAFLNSLLLLTRHPIHYNCAYQPDKGATCIPQPDITDRGNHTFGSHLANR